MTTAIALQRFVAHTDYDQGLIMPFEITHRLAGFGEEIFGDITYSRNRLVV